MELIPAVDLREGRVVRLEQGVFDREHRYPLDPVEAARRWVAAGARRIHLVDLDGARARVPSGRAPEGAGGLTPNARAVAEVCRAVPVPVQLGGGLRSLEAVEAAHALGVDRVILGTVVVRDPGEAERILRAEGGRAWVSLDLRDGRLAVAGWEEEDGAGVAVTAQRAAEQGAGGLVVTAVGRDGTLAGPDLDALRPFLGLGVPVLAAGGVGHLDHLRRLRDLEPQGLAGAIVGRALYEERFTLEEALEVAAGAG
ncbi:1-(5-phosphoribosyl)-5-[(5-phosphoribosylamino)methylideneamino]imidazole-4-carboxamide isomerase [Limnochorda pilosa]|uniref:1-(5-phosphoribosyl)-5-[(5-phosphoribosylamino)methylideneamino] imidazole-4-carboxamide isomerase n=1 Tax=Limnochorda pilosa TaxID=1555112 RepID=A0A0K2SPB8_LIMPI|nr:1-(5-phosphoribosyl)-5-[(5-phosphoribosylamino)methylideneamino] imidazole-4-carboxamide isomerase [Limnochorda pilosa]BAS28649.1 1-(5-phosphoribosyl)-5-[(5-phosphoribosylamino) methylideneamino] imidazole-4-carboxamide isomerase [Limnochorda pilosa]